MKKLILLTMIVAFSVAGNFRAVPVEKAQMLQDGKTEMFCNVCGMTLPKFYKTNHAASVEGKTHQYCSIHCMHEEAAKKGLHVKNPKVVDNDTLKFIESKDAFYVVGSSKPATMSMVSKYAFGTKITALDFAKKYGGEVMSYNEVSKKVSLGLEKTIKAIEKKDKPKPQKKVRKSTS